MNKHFFKRLLSVATQTFLLAGLFLAILVVFEFFQLEKERAAQVDQISLFKKNQDGSLTKVLGESDEEGGVQVQGTHQGNLFVAHSIKISGETVIDLIDDEEGLIEVSHLQGKLYRASEEDEINYYTSWQTNKSTISNLRYKSDKDVDYSEIKESNFGHNHSIIIPNIDFSSVYEYSIESSDKWGNKNQTGQFVFYTGAPEASFFELLEESFRLM